MIFRLTHSCIHINRYLTEQSKKTLINFSQTTYNKLSHLFITIRNNNINQYFTVRFSFIDDLSPMYSNTIGQWTSILWPCIHLFFWLDFIKVIVFVSLSKISKKRPRIANEEKERKRIFFFFYSERRGVTWKGTLIKYNLFIRELFVFSLFLVPCYVMRYKNRGKITTSLLYKSMIVVWWKANKKGKIWTWLDKMLICLSVTFSMY